MQVSFEFEEYTALKSEIERHNKLYYDNDSPEISDYEYDMLMRQLIELEQKYPEFDTVDSPSKRVGGKADNTFEKVTHTVRMESLQDAFSKQEIYDFEK